MRKRSALLEALELLRETDPGLTLTQIMALLYVADEEDPLPLPDLQRRMDVTANHAWRTAQALAAGEACPPLVVRERWKASTASALRLSPAGLRLRTELDQIIEAARPISPHKENRPTPKGSAGDLLGVAAS